MADGLLDLVGNEDLTSSNTIGDDGFDIGFGGSRLMKGSIGEFPQLGKHFRSIPLKARWRAVMFAKSANNSPSAS
ncbi:hypothetical protein QBK99_05210 [Corticibacterium sp. UT-5YL-CI-8]|nr:hypothetical protein [Tianweitania sp. UT-5YL-CI-8]